MGKLGRYLVVLFLLIQVNSFAQITFETVSVSVGVIKNNFSPAFVQDEVSLYPKLGIRGKFFKDNIYWKAFISYWDDNDDNQWISNAVVYTYKSYNAGLGLQIAPKGFLDRSIFGIRLNAGFSVHFYRGKYLRGETELGETDKSEQKETTPYFDTGAELFFKFSEIWQPFIEAEYSISLDNWTLIPQPYHISLGMCYNFVK